MNEKVIIFIHMSPGLFIWDKHKKGNDYFTLFNYNVVGWLLKKYWALKFVITVEKMQQDIGTYIRILVYKM